jgi:hypothetical protein
MSYLLLQQSVSLILVKTGNSMPGPFVGIHDLVGEMPMGLAHAAVCLAFCAGIVFANQTVASKMLRRSDRCD